VRPVGAKTAIAGELLGKGARVHWKGWWPIWASRASTSNNDQTHFHYRPISISFFRGSMNADQLVSRAFEIYNSLDRIGGDCGARHRIEFISGSAGKPMILSQEGIEKGGAIASPAVGHDRPEDLHSMRLLDWKPTDLGPVLYGGNAIDRMYLCDGAASIIEEIRAWLRSRDWHRERGLPWKRGFGLTGVPGTGKTTLVRAIGEDFALPIFAFDLATLYNDELRREWQRVQAHTPCIVLFDDVDGVYHDRENAKETGPSFDCFINCLDGVGRSDGIITFISTNRPELLASALTRPGRIDRLVEMTAPDAAGRLKIARRILSDWPDAAARMVQEGVEDSGAMFERRCADLALDLFWNGANQERIAS